MTSITPQERREMTTAMYHKAIEIQREALDWVLDQVEKMEREQDNDAPRTPNVFVLGYDLE